MTTEIEKKSRSLAAAERRAEEAAGKAAKIRKHESLIATLKAALKLATARDYKAAAENAEAARAESMGLAKGAEAAE